MNLPGCQMEAVLNHVHDGLIVVDREGRIVLLNSAAQKLANGNGAIGKDVRLVIPNSRLPLVIQSGVEEVNQLHQLGETLYITSRYPIRNETGKISGAVAIFRDITEVGTLKEQINSLQDIRTLLSAILEATQDAISVVDENGMGILINSAYTRLTGLTEADVINQSATVDIAEGESAHLRVLKTMENMRGVPMKVGPKRKEVLVYGSPIIVQGKLRGSVAVIHDVSEILKLSEELERAKRVIRQLKSEYTFPDIIGESNVIKAAVDKAISAAKTPATVLLRGETGTGKELFAHAIHHASDRRNRQFIRINCAALSESILESELFGYAEGAFTGAKRGGRIGLFEEANGGTLFLDEIGDISFSLQLKLLRVLQEKEIVRVGHSRAIVVDVRVIAATNANLEEKIRAGTFRKDLFYRLNVFPILIPSLRHRINDIKPLTDYLIRKCNQEYGRSVEGIGDSALQVLMAYSWPGNVRELENVIRRTMINMRNGESCIDCCHLPDLRFELEDDNDEMISYRSESFDSAYAQWEKEVLIQTMDAAHGNKTKAAQILNISLRNLYYKLQKRGLY